MSTDPSVEVRKIGVVGVDSGQLMVIDPCYVDSEWVHKGAVRGLLVWGGNYKPVKERLLKLRPDIKFTKEQLHPDKNEGSGSGFIEETDAKKVEALIEDLEKAEAEADLNVMRSIKTDSTYDKCCDLTISDAGSDGGQLNYKMGHPGLGVVFSSGFGDGVYEVFAHYKDCGDWGTRISKVEIVMIEDEE